MFIISLLYYILYILYLFVLIILLSLKSIHISCIYVRINIEVCVPATKRKKGGKFETDKWKRSKDVSMLHKFASSTRMSDNVSKRTTSEQAAGTRASRQIQLHSL